MYEKGGRTRNVSGDDDHLLYSFLRTWSPHGEVMVTGRSGRQQLLSKDGMRQDDKVKQSEFLASTHLFEVTGVFFGLATDIS